MLLALAACPAFAQSESPGSGLPVSFQPGPGNFTFGGSVGFGFGGVNWVSVSPQVGYLVTPRLWSGVNARLQYTNDTRYEPHFDSFDYGFGVFMKYFVIDRVFASAEWTWQNYATRTVLGEAGRQSTSAVYLGGGYAQPLGGSAALVLEAAYDVTGNAKSLYGTAWALRAGVATGF